MIDPCFTENSIYSLSSVGGIGFPFIREMGCILEVFMYIST